jgi:uncharacterized protein YecE (DUF72 family)
MAPHGKATPDRFRFRNLHPNVHIGMASDRYAGWIGQVYSEERYKGQITHRTHTVGGKAFVEEVLPVESVEEYFEHFPVLEIDYTFYRLLLERDGKPTQNYHVLKKYREHMKEGDDVILKVPQVIFARRLRRGGGFVENEAYLNAGIFTGQFYKPAVEILGSTLAGFIFEQEYHPKKDRLDPAELAKSLDRFFETIPRDTRYHVELRTEAYLTELVLQVLEKHGVGLVLSHWTWLPPLKKQFGKSGSGFFNSAGQGVVRLITPLRMSYEDSYERGFPFDRMVEGMMNPQMIEDAVHLMREAIKREKKIVIIINNRAGGNGPLTASTIVTRFQAVDPHPVPAVP